MRVQNVRDFPQTKLDSEINALFSWKGTVTPTFYFIISMRTVPSVTEKKIAEIDGYFFGK